MKKVFDRIGIGQKDEFGQPYEEWFITDYDCYVGALYDKLGEGPCCGYAGSRKWSCPYPAGRPAPGH